MTNNPSQKLAVTLWNYKGGVGKSTISLILAEIAATQGLHTLAIDIDEQQNLAEALNLTASQRTPFLALYSNLWEAFSSMCAGNFTNLWR